jgi:agmatine deiminase
MGIAGPTPHEDGFRMPARFSRHERTYLAWPTATGYRPDLDRSCREYAAIATAISEFEPVTLIVHPDDAAGAAGYLGGAPKNERLELPINDAWIRNSGPIFVGNDNGEVALVDLQSTGWSGRLACDLDMRLGHHLSERLGGPEDEAALAIPEGFYPDRTMVPAESTALTWDGGGVGCITQQQPAGRPAQ